jgi:hypothetical protein
MKRTLRTSLVTTALSCAALVSASAAGATAGEHKVATKPAATAGPPADAATVRCNGLRNGLTQHIEAMKTLNAQIQKERQTPSDVEGMFEQWSGSRRTALGEISAKLAKERRTTEEIAALLPAYKCPPVDIDAELKKPPMQKPAATASQKRKGKVY